MRLEGDRLVAANGAVLDGDNEIVDTIKAIAGGNATIFRGDLRVATNVEKPDGSRAIGTRLAPGPAHDAVLRDGRLYQGRADILGVAHFVAYDPINDAQGQVIGILYVGVKTAEFLAVVDEIARIAAQASLGFIVLGGAALFFAVRAAFRPLDALRRTMGELAGGDLQVAVPALGRNDEIGRMAAAIQSFKHGAVAARRLALEREAEQRAKAVRAERIESLVCAFDMEATKVLHAVATAATELDATAGSMAKTADQGASRAGRLAAVSGDASASVGIVAAAAEQMAASVAEVARQMADSAATARQAVDAARAGDATMRGLAEGAERIGSVVRLIASVAGRTKLLALNAAIEAARAGKAGAGFAVVAAEVKQLAQQTATATQDIEVQIKAMQGETGRAVETIRDIAGTVGTLNRLAAQAATTAKEQMVATHEIQLAMREAAAGTQAAAQHAGWIMEGALQTSAAASQVRSASGDLAHHAEGLLGRLDAFLASIRPTEAAGLASLGGGESETLISAAVDSGLCDPPDAFSQFAAMETP